MAITAALAALSIIPSLVKAGLGIYQGIKGSRMAKAAGDQPQMEIPQGVLDALSTVQGLAGQTELPGQDIMEGKLASRTAAGVARLAELSQSSAAATAGLANLYGEERQGLQGLAQAAAQFYAQNQRGLASQQNVLGGWQQKQFLTNELIPWQQAMQAAAAMKGAGMQNLAGGITEGAGTLGAAALGQQGGGNYANYLSGLYGSRQSQAGFDTIQNDDMLGTISGISSLYGSALR